MKGLSNSEYYTYMQEIEMEREMLKAMTDKEFCEVYSSYYGERIDNIKQLVKTTLTGEELKDLIEHFIIQLSEDNHSNQAY